MAKSKSTEASLLEQYRVALNNASAQPVVAKLMAELGYNAKKIEEGKKLLAATRSAFDSNRTEDDETLAAYASFTAIKEELHEVYRLHRKKAKVVFRKEAVIAENLNITGSMPEAYVKWLEEVKRFYSVALADKAIQAKLAMLKLTPQELNQANTLIAKLESARGEYLKEKGESQEATKIKNDAFEKIDEWMSEFYAVARIALENSPQLLEALGKTVKS